MQKRWFLWEHIIWALLVLRPFYTHHVSTLIFSVVVIAIFVAKYFLEGFTIIAFTMFTLFLTGILTENS
jgi:predicted neutral ceramidase superfamily lipid hydrolase